MSLTIFTPPVADETEVLDFSLVALTEAISQVDADALSHGCLGGEFGYGARCENDVFMMHPYCWCEHVDCLWCTVWLSNETECTEEQAEEHRRKQVAEVFAVYGYGGFEQAPNFWHKPSGLQVCWYKWIGRDMQVRNPRCVNIADVFRECLASVKPAAAPSAAGAG